MTKHFAELGKAALLIDGQFGSTGKGLITAYLAQHNKFHIATTNASANAGHTTVIGDRKFVTFHTPTTAVMDPNCIAYLNAGAIIDPEVLAQEIIEFGLQGRLIIHPHAAVIYQHHRDAEREAASSATKIGSTQKGVGAALADKLMRRGNVAKNDPFLSQFIDPSFHLGLEMDEHGAAVIVEVPQGFSLSLNSGFYPYTTSREVTVAQGIADAGLHPGQLGKVMMTARTFPIRVGNIQDEFGREIGNSGGGYPDQPELAWENFPGVEPERTTVTKRVRRIFTWSDLQWLHSVQTLKPDFVFLNFVNYLTDRTALAELEARAGRLYLAPEDNGDLCRPFTHYGIGPDVADVFEHGADAAHAMEERGLWAK